MKKYQIVKLHYQFFSVRCRGKEIAVFDSFDQAKRYVRRMSRGR